MAFKWVVSAGHGPNTPGKRSPDGMKEYEFNSAVARYIKGYTIENYEGVEVYFPHSDSRDVPLKERSNFANKIGARCYTAIHGNASGSTWSSAHGIETFVYLSRPEEAYALALQVQRDLISATGLTDRGVKLGDLHEVREPDMTAILCECGFMTNQTEVALLRSDAYRRKVAIAIVKAHAVFFGWKKKAVAPTSTPAPIKKEEDEMPEKAIVVTGYPDLSAAEILQSKLGDAGIHFKKNIQGKKVAKHLFVVGGNKDGLVADKYTVLSGANRLDTMNAVWNYK